ncbi:hypothetical protein ACFX2A_000382 [Malus domestica]
MESRPVIPTRFRNDRVMEDVKARGFALHKSASASTLLSPSTPTPPFQLQRQKQQKKMSPKPIFLCKKECLQSTRKALSFLSQIPKVSFPL